MSIHTLPALPVLITLTAHLSRFATKSASFMGFYSLLHGFVPGQRTEPLFVKPAFDFYLFQIKAGQKT